MQFGPHRFRLPVVPANMKTVVDESITELLAREGYFYVMHRFDLDSLVMRMRHARQRPAGVAERGRQASRP